MGDIKKEPPTDEQMQYIGKICGASGLFACKKPETKEEADRIIFEFLHPGRPYCLHRPFSMDKIQPLKEEE